MVREAGNPASLILRLVTALLLCAAALSTVAIAAVNGTVAPRAKRHLGFGTTLGANDRMHLPRTPVETATVVRSLRTP